MLGSKFDVTVTKIGEHKYQFDRGSGVPIVIMGEDALGRAFDIFDVGWQKFGQLKDTGSVNIKSTEKQWTNFGTGH